MSSLNAHLRLPEDHSGLPFHPSCPVCRRDRLAGSLEGDELVSRRMRAAIAVGLLAFSAAGAPGAAVAQVPDEVIDGSADVVETSEAGSLELGETTVPLNDAGPAPAEDEAAADVQDGAPIDEPSSAEVVADEPLIDAGGEASEPAVEPAPAAEPVAVAAPPAEVPATTDAPEQVAADEPRVDSGGRTKREGRVDRVQPPVQHRGVAAPAPLAPPAATEPAAPVAIRVEAGTSASASARDVSDGDRFHVVQRGESLWSIAADVLGQRASVARIAREVNRLWALNEDRIASGNPDLLYAGTRLRLR